VWVASKIVAEGDAKPAPIELPDELPEAAVAPAAQRSAFRKRFATSLAFSMLFFAGAAFTAGAGNELAPDVTSNDATAAFVAEATVPSPAPEVVTVEAPAEAAPAPAADSSDAVPVTPSPSAQSTARVVTAQAPAVQVAPRTAAPKHARRVAAVSVPALAPLAPIPFEAITFNPQAWLHNNPASPMGASAVGIAQHYLRVPYVWGGAVPATGFDCSGLTRFVYAQLGVNLPHYAASQFAAFAKLDPAQLQAGDLVFFEPKFDGPGHVALYIGNDQMIEAPHTGALVRISSFSGAAARMGFLGAVRPYTVVAAASSPLQTPVYLRAE
jgi:cell wall-associated NlpC family hydrolase